MGFPRKLGWEGKRYYYLLQFTNFNLSTFFCHCTYEVHEYVVLQAKYWYFEFGTQRRRWKVKTKMNFQNWLSLPNQSDIYIKSLDNKPEPIACTSVRNLYWILRLRSYKNLCWVLEIKKLCNQWWLYSMNFIYLTFQFEKLEVALHFQKN